MTAAITRETTRLRSCVVSMAWGSDKRNCSFFPCYITDAPLHRDRFSVEGVRRKLHFCARWLTGVGIGRNLLPAACLADDNDVTFSFAITRRPSHLFSLM